MKEIMSIRIEQSNRKWIIKQRFKTGENFTKMFNRLVSEEIKREKEKSIDKKTSN